MSIVDSPPPAQQLVIRRLGWGNLPGHIPRFLGTDEMHHTDRTLEVLIGRDVLVVCAGCAVIREAEPMPVPKMHIQEALVGAVEADAPFCQRFEREVVLHIGSQNHYTTVEAIGPSHVGDCGKIYF